MSDLHCVFGLKPPESKQQEYYSAQKVGLPPIHEIAPKVHKSALSAQRVHFCTLLGALSGIGGNPTFCVDKGFCCLGSVARTETHKTCNSLVRNDTSSLCNIKFGRFSWWPVNSKNKLRLGRLTAGEEISEVLKNGWGAGKGQIKTLQMGSQHPSPNLGVPNLVVSNLQVVCDFYPEALFCSVLHPFALVRALRLLCTRLYVFLRLFAYFCVQPRLERPP